MNIYLEKVASFTKKAFNVDFEEGNYYGIAANRSIRHPDVIGILRRASKSKDVRIGISQPYGEEVTSENHKEFHALLDQIAEKVKNNGGYDPDSKYSMNWDRDHVWSMSFDKTHPSIQKNIGKEDEWGEIHDEHSLIFEKIHKLHS